MCTHANIVSRNIARSRSQWELTCRRTSSSSAPYSVVPRQWHPFPWGWCRTPSDGAVAHHMSASCWLCEYIASQMESLSDAAGVDKCKTRNARSGYRSLEPSLDPTCVSLWPLPVDRRWRPCSAQSRCQCYSSSLPFCPRQCKDESQSTLAVFQVDASQLHSRHYRTVRYGTDEVESQDRGVKRRIGKKETTVANQKSQEDRIITCHVAIRSFSVCHDNDSCFFACSVTSSHCRYIVQ